MPGPVGPGIGTPGAPADADIGRPGECWYVPRAPWARDTRVRQVCGRLVHELALYMPGEAGGCGPEAPLPPGWRQMTSNASGQSCCSGLPCCLCRRVLCAPCVRARVRAACSRQGGLRADGAARRRPGLLQTRVGARGVETTHRGWRRGAGGRRGAHRDHERSAAHARRCPAAREQQRGVTRRAAVRAATERRVETVRVALDTPCLLPQPQHRPDSMDPPWPRVAMQP